MVGGVHEIAVLYAAMMDARSIGPREVDEMELWECAVALGVLADPTGENGKEAHRKSRSAELIRQRIEAARNPDAPEPEVHPVNPDTLAVGRSFGAGDAA